jgi:DNA-directed RNA polymerase subunit RPC12/RpoP
MDYHCPYCETSLKWKLLQTKATTGQRQIFPGSATFVCPTCGGRLLFNTHPIEKKHGRWYLPLLMVFIFTTFLRNYLSWVTLGLFFLAGIAVVAIFYYRVVLPQVKSWPRYKKFS